MLARSKLNNIEGKISEALINNEISQEDFMTIINKERNYGELKENIKMIKDQEDKKIDTDYAILYKNHAILLSKVQKNTENINPVVSKTRNGGTMIESKCAICGTKKSRFIKKQEAKGLLSNLGITPP